LTRPCTSFRLERTQPIETRGRDRPAHRRGDGGVPGGLQRHRRGRTVLGRASLTRTPFRSVVRCWKWTASSTSAQWV